MKTPIQTIMEQVEEEHLLEETLTRLNARVTGFTVGALCATSLALATLILVLKGGPNMGRHLNLLGQFFPFYEVSWLGVLLAVLYGGVTGFLAGYAVSRIYNLAARSRPSGA